MNRWARLAILGLAAATTAALAPTTPAAAVGSTPTPTLTTIGNNVAALARCPVGTHTFTAVAGDITAVTTPAGHTQHVNRVFLADRNVHTVMWPGQAITGGYVNALACTATGAHTARLFVGGTYTAVGGHRRHHFAAYDITQTSHGFRYTLTPISHTLTNRVGSIATGAGRVYVPTGWGVTAYNTATGRPIWHTHTDCGVNAVFYWSHRLYVGGAFLGVGYPGHAGYFRQYGMAALNAATGAPIRTFHPGRLPANETDCHHPPTSDHSAFSGDQPKAFGYIPGVGLLFGGGGKVNLAGLVTPAGRWVWLRHMIGDGQAIVYLGHGYVAIGHHRSGAAIHSYTWEWDGVCAIVHAANGYQIHWPLDSMDDRYNPDAPNRDGGNNGVEAAVIVNGHLVLGGAMVTPRRGLVSVPL